MESVIKAFIEKRAARCITRFAKRIQPLNTVCSLTMSELRPPIFRYYPGQDYRRRPIGYSLESIMQGISITGKLVDPCTREEYSERDLKRLETLAVVYHLDSEFDTPSVMRSRLLQRTEAEVITIFETILNPSEETLDSVLSGWVYQMFLQIISRLRAVEIIERESARQLVARMISTAYGDRAFDRYHHYIEGNMRYIFEQFLTSLFEAVSENSANE